VNLAFMGANDGFWHVRYEDGRRTVVGYKYSPDPDPDPAQRTTEFRWLTPDRSECQLLGVEFHDVVLINRNIDATADSAVARDPWFAGTGLVPGSVLTGLGGGETDEITPGCHVPPVTPLLSYSGAPLTNGTPARGDAVRYTACSGAEVFSAGSLQFSWGLDSWRDPSYSGPGLAPVPPDNPGLQQAMTNALTDLTRSHVPVPGPPRICVPTAGVSMPGTWIAVGQSVRLQSTATDPYGQISSQRWNVTLNGTSVSASGPSVTRFFWRPGVASVTLAVADSSGATATKTETLRVCQCPAPGQRHSIPWPPGAQTGPPCQLMGLGSLHALARGLSFAANTAIKRFSITAYRVTVRRRRIAVARLAVSSSAHSSGAVALPRVRASMLIVVSARAAGHVWRQQFVVPSGSAQPGVASEALCDGTSGQILSPVFGGPRSVPLRVAVSGPGRVTVSLLRVGGGAFYRRVVTSRRRTVIISFAFRRLPRGVYRVTVDARQSRLPQPVRLTALAL
jgi:hypothetical protein